MRGHWVTPLLESLLFATSWAYQYQPGSLHIGDGEHGLVKITARGSTGVAALGPSESGKCSLGHGVIAVDFESGLCPVTAVVLGFSSHFDVVHYTFSSQDVSQRRLVESAPLGAWQPPPSHEGQEFGLKLELPAEIGVDPHAFTLSLEGCGSVAEGLAHQVVGIERTCAGKEGELVREKLAGSIPAHKGYDSSHRSAGSVKRSLTKGDAGEGTGCAAFTAQLTSTKAGDDVPVISSSTVVTVAAKARPTHDFLSMSSGCERSSIMFEVESAKGTELEGLVMDLWPNLNTTSIHLSTQIVQNAGLTLPMVFAKRGAINETAGHPVPASLMLEGFDMTVQIDGPVSKAAFVLEGCGLKLDALIGGRLGAFVRGAVGDPASAVEFVLSPQVKCSADTPAPAPTPTEGVQEIAVHEVAALDVAVEDAKVTAHKAAAMDAAVKDAKVTAHKAMVAAVEDAKVTAHETVVAAVDVVTENAQVPSAGFVSGTIRVAGAAVLTDSELAALDAAIASVTGKDTSVVLYEQKRRQRRSLRVGSVGHVDVVFSVKLVGSTSSVAEEGGAVIDTVTSSKFADVAAALELPQEQLTLLGLGYCEGSLPACPSPVVSRPAAAQANGTGKKLTDSEAWITCGLFALLIVLTSCFGYASVACSAYLPKAKMAFEALSPRSMRKKDMQDPSYCNGDMTDIESPPRPSRVPMENLPTLEEVEAKQKMEKHARVASGGTALNSGPEDMQDVESDENSENWMEIYDESDEDGFFDRHLPLTKVSSAPVNGKGMHPEFDEGLRRHTVQNIVRVPLAEAAPVSPALMIDGRNVGGERRGSIVTTRRSSVVTGDRRSSVVTSDRRGSATPCQHFSTPNRKQRRRSSTARRGSCNRDRDGAISPETRHQAQLHKTTPQATQKPLDGQVTPQPPGTVGSSSPGPEPGASSTSRRRSTLSTSATHDPSRRRSSHFKYDYHGNNASSAGTPHSGDKDALPRLSLDLDDCTAEVPAFVVTTPGSKGLGKRVQSQRTPASMRRPSGFAEVQLAAPAESPLSTSLSCTEAQLLVEISDDDDDDDEEEDNLGGSSNMMDSYRIEGDPDLV